MLEHDTQSDVRPVANPGSGTPGARALPRVEPGVKRVRGNENAALIKINEPLDDTNWFNWRPHISLVLKLCGVYAHIKGEIARPDPVEDPVGADNWSFNDTYAQLLITINLTPSQMVYVGGCTAARDMWANLKAMHESGAKVQRYYNCLFHTRAEDGEDIGEHLNKVLRYREGISLMGRSDLVPDLLFKGAIAASLPPSWDKFTSPYVEGEKRDLVTPLQLIGIIKEESLYRESRKDQEVTLHSTKVFGMSCSHVNAVVLTVAVPKIPARIAAGDVANPVIRKMNARTKRGNATSMPGIWMRKVETRVKLRVRNAHAHIPWVPIGSTGLSCPCICIFLYIYIIFDH